VWARGLSYSLFQLSFQLDERHGTAAPAGMASIPKSLNALTAGSSFVIADYLTCSSTTAGQQAVPAINLARPTLIRTHQRHRPFTSCRLMRLHQFESATTRTVAHEILPML
jgi:hypothetical protein